MKRICILLVLFLTVLLTGSALGESESFLVIADMHFTEDAQENHSAAREAVIRAARGKDAVLLLGDNTSNSRSGEHTLFLQWVQELSQHTGTEIWLIPGNHDYTSSYGPEEYTVQYQAFGWDRAFSRDPASASYAAMTEKGTCLLMLDTNQFQQGHLPLPYGGIPGDMLIWIQTVLETLPDGTPVLACGHHPILPPERDELTPGAKALAVILRSYGANLYLCGHEHGFATTEKDGLRQITIGQPQSWPGLAGLMMQEEGAFRWQPEPLYDEESLDFIAMREKSRSLGREMAKGTLAGTPYDRDEAAVEWFSSAFMLFADGDMTPEKSARLLADENCAKWRRVETRTVVKDWILGLLENPPEDVRNITLPLSRKHALTLP